MTARQIVDQIIYLYTQYGHEDYIGEPVSQLEHMVQCAQIADSAGADEETILAAFFHDIGHFCEHIVPEKVQYMDGYGIVDHEKLGADFLRQLGFSEKICKLVGSHVNAKRYLTFKDQNYLAQLSDASKETLRFQGGSMREEEALAFESDPYFPLYILLRRWDEMGKRPGMETPNLVPYFEMMERHLKNKQAEFSV